MGKHFAKFQKSITDILLREIPLSYLHRIDSPLILRHNTEYKLGQIKNEINTHAEQIDHALSVDYWQDSKKQVGFVSTPQGIRAKLLSDLNIDFDKKICLLDPACGSGLLLIEVLLSFLAKKKKYDKSISNFLSSSLFGIDISPVAIECCRLAILTTIINKYPEAIEQIVSDFFSWRSNFICGNALLDIENNTFKSRNNIALSSNAISITKLFPNLIKGFSHIIANPPYGLSRDEQIGLQELSLLKTIYSDVIAGKPNKYLLFLIRSLDLLQEEGRLSMVIPNSWLGIDNAKKVREYILKKGYLEEITVFEGKEFKGNEVEVVTVCATKKFNESFYLSTFNKSSENKAAKTVMLKSATLLKSPESKIPTKYSEAEEAFWSKIIAGSVPLSSIMQVYIALQVYALGKGNPPQTAKIVKEHPFHSLKKTNSKNQYPYLQGKDVGRYKLDWSGQYLDYGPWVSEFQPISRYQGPRILVREVLGKAPYLLQATYADKTFLYNRSILHILPQENMDPHIAEKTCLAILTIINSKFGSAYLTRFGKKTNRKLFPKVLAADLRDFPIPKDFYTSSESLANYSRHSMLGKQAIDKDQVLSEILDSYGISKKTMGGNPFAVASAGGERWTRN